MFKFVVLFALLALAAAKPSGNLLISEPSHVEVHEPTIARVGDYVESVPSAVSHQSSTVVHSRANIVTPIVAPAVRTHLAPVVKTYSAPIVHAAPAPILHAAPAPIISTYAAAPVLRTYAAHTPVLRTYAAPAPILRTTYSTSPLHYTATGPAYAYAGAPLLRSW